LERIFSVVPVPWLLGKDASRSALPPTDAVQAVLRAANPGGDLPTPLGEVRARGDGTWICRFLTTIDPRLGQVKLDLLWEEGGMAVDSRQLGVVAARKQAPAPPPSGLFNFGKQPR